MKPTARDIAQAAIDSAFEMLKQNGLESDAKHFPKMLRDAAMAREQTLVAIITTPTGDAGALKDTIRENLKKRFGREIEIEEKKDESLLGGAVIEFGDERIDMSVKGALTDVAQTLRSDS